MINVVPLTVVHVAAATHKPDMRETDKDARTVFVRNINFGIDEAKLEDRFGDIGPVRQCFLVRNRGEEQHRGFGFVQYAIPEDADRAVQELNGAELHGRQLKVIDSS
jgi:nucleolar protein 4